jgi:hypothetical protein
MMTTPCIAMSVGKVSDGTQCTVDTCRKLQPHLETKRLKKRPFQARTCAAQCCSVLFNRECMQVPAQASPPLEAT